MINWVLQQYGINPETAKLKIYGTGLINRTWKLVTPGKEYILQRVNNSIFENPADISGNINLLTAHLKLYFPGYLFVSPLVSNNGNEIIYKKMYGYFRLFPFIPGTHSKDVAETPQQAYEAAVQFGRFTSVLSHVDVSKLKITIPEFHNLALRYKMFLQSLNLGNKKRVAEADALVKLVVKYQHIVTTYNQISKNPQFRLRVTHHDTKISNVLFDGENNGICVIDLDTVMPGYFISDVGDMMRTYLSPVNEDEKNFNKIEVREEFYEAIVLGYFNEMKEQLTEVEKEHFFFAGIFMIYMQAVRFLTDYFNNDIYYGAKYPQHNWVRAANQIILLERLLEKEQKFISILKVKI